MGMMLVRCWTLMADGEGWRVGEKARWRAPAGVW